MGYVLCFASIAATYWAGRRSLVRGLMAMFTVGYLYGILRANFLDSASHFLFDAAVLGLYAAQLNALKAPFHTLDGQRLRHWFLLLTFWPVVLFFIPIQDTMVQLVGLRGCIFLLPFLLIGARLTRRDYYNLALWLAVLNVGALVLACVEYIVGIERFFPHNAVTLIIYASSDVGETFAYRIPSCFANAHSYGGTMVVTLPLLIGAWVQDNARVWLKNLLLAGIAAAMLGVFLSAARSHFLVMTVAAVVVTLSARFRPLYRVGWVVIILGISLIVAREQRLQRFTTLSDSEFISHRFHSSVNDTLFGAIAEYPFGNGLGGGGTSMPYFLADKVRYKMMVESELARIQLENGLVGVVAWLAFIAWIYTRRRPNPADPWYLGVRVARYTSMAILASGLIGIGLFTAVPASCMLLVLLGWVSTAHTGEANEALLASASTAAPQPMWNVAARGLTRP